MSQNKKAQSILKTISIVTLLTMTSCPPKFAPCTFSGEEFDEFAIKVETCDDYNTRTSHAQSMPEPGKEIALCISGGSGRSFSSAIGQIAAIKKLGLYDKFKVLSTVSGSSWFGTIYTFAPDSITDMQLIGDATITPPDQLTRGNLNFLCTKSLGYCYYRMRNESFATAFIDILNSKIFNSSQYFSRCLGTILLEPFGLNSNCKFFTLNLESANRIIDKNPNLTMENFYLPHDNNRLFLICNSTFINTFDSKQLRYSFEYSPLSCGTPQLIEYYKTEDETFFIGGGFIETFAFNSTSPKKTSENNIVEALLSNNGIFTLSDMIGSSGAAPGWALDLLHMEKTLPMFNVWSPKYIKPGLVNKCSLVDGGNIDDLGIIPLLQRGYKRIILFVNSEFPIDTADSSDCEYCYRGIDGYVGRLFGFLPKNILRGPLKQNTQVFPSVQYSALDSALKIIKKDTNRNTVPYFMDTYKIVQPNPFDISMDSVSILWVYNDINPTWKKNLSNEVKSLFSDRSDTLNIVHFPNYNTIFQNKKQLFWLNRVQINLLANMWYNTLVGDSELKRELVDFVNNN